MALLMIGNAMLNAGQPKRALEYFDQAKQISLEIGNPTGAASDETSSAAVYQSLGEFEKALDL